MSANVSMLFKREQCLKQLLRLSSNRIGLRQISQKYAFSSKAQSMAERDTSRMPRSRFSYATRSQRFITTQQALKPEKRPIYLDYQATTPVDPRVLDAMLPFCVDMYGNAHSRSHSFGWEAEHFVEEARSHVAKLLGAQPREVVFTSGATESNNTLIKGIAAYYANQNPRTKNHIITTQTEHKCVLASCRDAQEQFGFDVTYLPVGPDGILNPETLKAAIRPDTALVSVLMVNNEIGAIQSVEAIGKICSEEKVLFHTDAAQAVGKIPIDIHKMNIDLLSLSGHKMYGPKGVGAMVIKLKRPRTRLVPILSGGGQERGLRSGTLPVPLVVGLGAAARVASEEMEADREHVTRLAKKLHDEILRQLPDVTLNGSLKDRYPGNINFSFKAVEGESLLMSLKNIALSSGSACTSASLEPSYVLRAIGVGDELAHTSLRFGFGRFTTEEEVGLQNHGVYNAPLFQVDVVIKCVVENVKRLREISPLWDNDGQNDSKPVWT